MSDANPMEILAKHFGDLEARHAALLARIHFLQRAFAELVHHLPPGGREAMEGWLKRYGAGLDELNARQEPGALEEMTHQENLAARETLAFIGKRLAD